MPEARIRIYNRELRHRLSTLMHGHGMGGLLGCQRDSRPCAPYFPKRGRARLAT